MFSAKKTSHEFRLNITRDQALIIYHQKIRHPGATPLKADTIVLPFLKYKD